MESVFRILLENLYTILSGILAIIGSIIAYLTYRRGNTIKKLSDEINYLKKVNLDTTSKVDPEADRKLVGEAEKSIQILGINALAPLHHCREELISFLRRKKGTIQILLIDPSKKCFQKRVMAEKDSVGRIKSEWFASIKIIKEILHNTKGHGKIELKLYDARPDRSLLIIDALDSETYKGRMLINYYPEESGTRGYEGGQFLVDYSLIRDRDSFEKNIAHFSDLWSKYELTSVNTINGN
jgi:hypothetical protein